MYSLQVERYTAAFFGSNNRSSIYELY